MSGGFDQARDEVIAGGSDRVTALSKEPEGVLAHPVVNQLAVLRRRQEVRGTIGPDDWARAWAALQLPPWDKLRDHVDPGVSA